MTTIPSMAQASRRLQDININGKFAIVVMVFSTVLSFLTDHVFYTPFELNGGASLLIVLSLIFIIPWLFLFICNFIRGNTGDNQYGKDPKML
nr:DUF805 domain-containing protein [Macrococcus caseolyticus]